MKELKFFFSRWLKNPFQMGTIAPISVRLAKEAVKCVLKKEIIIEIGAGTGRLSRALIESGINPKNLWLIEIDPLLCDFLKKSLKSHPKCQESFPTIIQGDARFLDEILPKNMVGTVFTIVSSIPLMYMEEPEREKIIKASFKVLRKGCEIIHVTYSPKSPIKFMKTIYQSRLKALWFNFPPGFVWRYREDYITKLSKPDHF